MEVQKEDNKTKLSFGHEDEYEYSDGYNFLVDEARRNREETSSGQVWRVTPVRHVPAALRSGAARPAGRRLMPARGRGQGPGGCCAKCSKPPRR